MTRYGNYPTTIARNYSGLTPSVSVNGDATESFRGQSVVWKWACFINYNGRCQCSIYTSQQTLSCLFCCRLRGLLRCLLRGLWRYRATMVVALGLPRRGLPLCQRKNDLPAGLAAIEAPRCGPHRYYHHDPINIISNSSAGWLIWLTMVE
jgi:hypothetical protein